MLRQFLIVALETLCGTLQGDLYKTRSPGHQIQIQTTQPSQHLQPMLPVLMKFETLPLLDWFPEHRLDLPLTGDLTTAESNPSPPAIGSLVCLMCQLTGRRNDQAKWAFCGLNLATGPRKPPAISAMQSSIIFKICDYLTGDLLRSTYTYQQVYIYTYIKIESSLSIRKVS